MKILNKELKLAFVLLGLCLYIAFFVADFTHAEPAGADVTIVTSSAYSSTPGNNDSLGGRIITMTLDVTQQNTAWKAYVGNITGVLVLRNSDGWSIFEWAMNSSTMSGNVFVSRASSVTWGNIKCANSTIVDSEQTNFGMATADTDSINSTFNYTIHKEMNGSITPITTSTCPSVATWINGSAQVVETNTTFQEILLYDNSNLVYATFITQDTGGYDNNASAGGANVTYDFQLIVAENRTAIAGTTYYFYADIS
ncbi:MAG: hypothetical protein KKF46_03430 [Nanoarchaeota archaeon]|nr:hypothetical protein [Nanoarchaeota archaeon]MBU1321386.1 hypothetical protein [Nanoarchaeota archaeon]MBU1597446.1 hypothetical protein [Nanoarchaeota archaeon]MBU2441348.1 hypothetical protein [Nanoarchaeota archaeon]